MAYAETQEACEELRDRYVADLWAIDQWSAAETVLRDWEDFVTFYHYPKDFMEAGKERLKGDTLRDADRAEVEGLKRENQRLKELVAELSVENLVLKKSLG